MPGRASASWWSYQRASVSGLRSCWGSHCASQAMAASWLAAVGWVAMTLNGGAGDGMPKVAAVKAPAVAVAAAAPAESVQRVSSAAGETSDREYVFAHQAMAPSPAMPGVAMYVRTVSDTRAAGER